MLSLFAQVYPQNPHIGPHRLDGLDILLAALYCGILMYLLDSIQFNKDTLK